MNSARVTHVSLASLDDRGIEGDNFVAQVRFEHAPMDTILLHIKKGRGDEYGAAGPWKITGFSWSVEY